MIRENLNCLQELDGHFYKLKSPFDFAFLNKYGKVFKIFDDQDSGNICFGCEKDGKRLFVKFAGAPTAEYMGTTNDAILRLKGTVPIYQSLHHKSLIKFIDAEEIGNGFAMIFEWADGECMGRMYPKSHKKFMKTDINTKVKIFNDILSFFEYIAEENFVAVDFYDGSIMYDFINRKVIICDIDFFMKQPCKNEMGRMWGSSLFMSPEEYQLGAVLDEITNVYTVGATAFALFGEYNRTEQDWRLNEQLFKVASKAVSENRMCRQQSIKEFIEEWKTALK